MSKINYGGPAFPFPTDRYPDGVMRADRNDGMTLRDYLAAKAMQGLLASEVNAPVEYFATRAYMVADAMMKAREA